MMLTLTPLWWSAFIIGMAVSVSLTYLLIRFRERKTDEEIRVAARQLIEEERMFLRMVNRP